jgi:hypothetical protein
MQQVLTVFKLTNWYLRVIQQEDYQNLEVEHLDPDP